MAPQEPPSRPELTVVTGLQDPETEWTGRRQDESPERQPEPIVVLLSGPNLALLGQRQPEVYGRDTLADHVSRATTVAAEHGFALEHVQSDYEGALVEAVHEALGVPLPLSSTRVRSVTTPGRFTTPSPPSTVPSSSST